MTVSDDWLSRDEAIKASGLNARTFARWESKGKFGGETKDGKKYYDPDVIAELAEDPELTTGKETVALLKETTNQLKTAFAHIDKLINSLVKPAEVVNKHYVDLVTTLTTQNNQYQDRWYQSLELVELVLSMQHERSRVDKNDDADRKRKDEAWELLKKTVPKALAQFGRGKKIRELFESLSVEQIASLIQAEAFLTDAQKASIQDIIKEYQKENQSNERTEQRTEDGKTETGTEGVPKPGSGSPAGEQRTNSGGIGGESSRGSEGAEGQPGPSGGNS